MSTMVTIFWLRVDGATGKVSKAITVEQADELCASLNRAWGGAITFSYSDEVSPPLAYVDGKGLGYSR